VRPHGGGALYSNQPEHINVEKYFLFCGDNSQDNNREEVYEYDDGT
jgi:hypothetical protein